LIEDNLKIDNKWTDIEKIIKVEERYERF